MKRSHEVDLTQGPILKKIILFALPLMATALLQTLYNVADMVVVGKFAENGSFAMGAVGSCSSLINLMIQLFLGLSTGVGISVAQLIGAGKKEDASRILHTSVLASLICGVLLTCFGFFAAESLLRLMNTPPTVLVEAVPYMKAYFIGMPATLLYNCLASGLRSSGDTTRPLIFLLVSGLLNVIFNVIMVVVFRLGAVGVGIATSISQVAAALMILLYMARIDGVCHLSFRLLRMRGKSLAAIVRYGLPAGLQNVVFSFSNVLIQSTVNRFDGGSGIIVAGCSASSSIEGIVSAIMSAFYFCVLTFVGQNVGAKTYHRIPKIIRTCLLCDFVMAVSASALILLCSKPLLALYVADSEISEAVKAAALTRMSIMITFVFLNGFMDVGTGTLGGMGKPNLALMMTVTGACGIRLLWIFTVCRLSEDIRVLYAIYPVTWLITAAAEFFCAAKLHKRMLRSV